MSGGSLWDDRDDGPERPSPPGAPGRPSSAPGEPGRPSSSPGAPGRPSPGSGEPGRPWASPERPGAGFDALARPTLPPAGAVPVDGPQLVLAGWWRRAVAAIIDTLLIGLVAGGLLIALGIGFFSAESEAETFAVGALSLLALAVAAVVTLLYAPVMMWLTNGRTVGRLLVGIRVVRANGKPMTLAVAAIREVVLKAVVFGLLSQATFGLAGLIDILWPLWDRENRALHDFGVDTRTVLA